MLTLLIIIISSMIITTLFSLYLLFRTKDDNKKLYWFFTITFLSFLPRSINEIFIYVFPIFPFPILQKIEYIFYLTNLTLFFPVFLTFLKIRSKYKINRIMVWILTIFAIIFGTTLMFLQYPPEYDYALLFPINIIMFCFAIFSFTYSFLFYLIKERENFIKESGISSIIIGLFLIVFGDMIFASISIEITYITLSFGIDLLYIGFKINSMIKYVNLLDLIEASVLIFDYNDKLLIMNPNSILFFKKIDEKFASDYLIGKRIPDIFSFLGLEDFEKHVFLLKTKKNPINISNIKKKLGFSEYILNIGFLPFIFNENGDINRYIMIINDMTEAIKSQKIVEDQQMKVNFFKILNQELRTPIFMIDGHVRSIKNYVQKIENENKRANFMNDINVIEKDLSNIITIIKNSDVYTSLELEMFNIKKKNQDFLPFIRGEIKEYEKLLAFRKQELDLTTSIKSLYLNFDEKNLSLALKNVIENRMKNSPIKSKISLIIEKIKDSLIVKVEDDGEKIKDGIKNNVFEIMNQSGLKQDAQETLLGLYIAKKIIEAHEGKISLQTEEKKMITIIEIPL